MLRFEPITKYERGLIAQLLTQGFADVLDDGLKKKIEQYDKDAFENLDTVGNCVFITTINDEIAGMVSWDPRSWPKTGIIGWNCVLPEHRDKGIGKVQIEEILKRFQNAGFEKALVKTSEHPFFKAAQKMYESCGFHISTRHQTGWPAGYGTIDYELTL